MLELKRISEKDINCGVLRVILVKGERVCKAKAEEAAERAIHWWFPITFSSAGQRNHCDNVSPVLHLKAKKVNKRLSNRGWKQESLPSLSRDKARAQLQELQEHTPGKSLFWNYCLG